MSSFTSGPWAIPDPQWDVDSPEPFKSLIRIADANGKDDVAYAVDADRAKLIAAAPEMLDALKEVKHWLEGWASAEAELDFVNRVIAKATA